VVANLWVSPWADALVLSHALDGLLPGSCFRRNTSAPACAHDQLADALASSASATAHLDTVREGYRVTRENQHVIIRQAFMGASRWELERLTSTVISVRGPLPASADQVLVAPLEVARHSTSDPQVAFRQLLALALPT